MQRDGSEPRAGQVAAVCAEAAVLPEHIQIQAELVGHAAMDWCWRYAAEPPR